MAINASLALKVQQKDDPIQHNNGIECTVFGRVGKLVSAAMVA